MLIMNYQSITLYHGTATVLDCKGCFLCDLKLSVKERCGHKPSCVNNPRWSFIQSLSHNADLKGVKKFLEFKTFQKSVVSIVLPQTNYNLSTICLWGKE